MQKRTIRKLPPATRQLARDISKIETYARRIKKRIEIFAELERENIAWNNRQEHFKSNGKVDPIGLDWPEQSALAKLGQDLK